MTSSPDDLTTDPQSIIAALRTEREAALAREAALRLALAMRSRLIEEFERSLPPSWGKLRWRSESGTRLLGC
jgi:hypothetical protein